MISRIAVLSVLMCSLGVHAEMTDVHQRLYDVDGQHGIIHFRGSVFTSPCVLDSASQVQEVVMNDVSARIFQHAGARSEPVPFTIKMKGCLAGARDTYITPPEVISRINQASATKERLIALSFIGETDGIHPGLLKLQGVRGLGLRVLDNHGKPLILNQGRYPYLLPIGDSNLQFTAVLESTQKNVSSGSYYGMMRLMLEYL